MEVVVSVVVVVGRLVVIGGTESSRGRYRQRPRGGGGYQAEEKGGSEGTVRGRSPVDLVVTLIAELLHDRSNTYEFTSLVRCSRIRMLARCSRLSSSCSRCVSSTCRASFRGPSRMLLSSHQ